jgi:nitroreductase
MSETIFIRRSIRRFLDTPIECEVTERIINAGMHAPSSMNAQPWEFLVLIKPETRGVIAAMSPYAGMAANAPVVIVTLANLEREKDEGWYVQDMAACTQNILLQIVEEGLGGVWLGIYPERQRMKMLQEAFGLPEILVPFSAIPFGYSDRINRHSERFEPSRIHYEGYRMGFPHLP